MWLSAVLASFATAATLTTWLTPVLKRHGALARPGPENVGRALPRGGGLAIVVVVGVAAGAVAWLAPDLRPAILAWLLPAAAVAAVSLRDDFRPLPAVLRLVVHAVAAVAFLAAVGPVREITIGGLGPVALGAAAWPLAVLWLVGMTNAFNFMDGIDGIAGLTAAVAGASVAVAADLAGCQGVAVVAGVFAAAALGFLSSNWPPAKVFMGDVGSTFCGFTLAAIPLVVSPAERGAVVLTAALAMWPFVFDAATTLIKRIARRENVFEAHRGHLYQRLVIAGWSHRRVASLYGLLAAVGGGVAVAPLVAPAVRPVADAALLIFVLTVPAVLVGLVGLVGQGYNPASQGLSR